MAAAAVPVLRYYTPEEREAKTREFFASPTESERQRWVMLIEMRALAEGLTNAVESQATGSF